MGRQQNCRHGFFRLGYAPAYRSVRVGPHTLYVTYSFQWSTSRRFGGKSLFSLCPRQDVPAVRKNRLELGNRRTRAISITPAVSICDRQVAGNRLGVFFFDRPRPSVISPAVLSVSPRLEIRLDAHRWRQGRRALLSVSGGWKTSLAGGGWVGRVSGKVTGMCVIRGGGGERRTVRRRRRAREHVGSTARNTDVAAVVFGRPARTERPRDVVVQHVVSVSTASRHCRVAVRKRYRVCYECRRHVSPAPLRSSPFAGKARSGPPARQKEPIVAAAAA